jgi:hypothetical protein
MLNQLNGISLGDSVNKYISAGLTPFDKMSYQLFAQMDIRRMFKGESFYWIDNNVLNGDPFDQAMVSAINGYVRKIRFGMTVLAFEGDQDQRAFSLNIVKDKLLRMMAPYGQYSELQKIPNLGEIYYWQYGQGNVAIEDTSLMCSINLTSSRIRFARPLGIFDRIMK